MADTELLIIGAGPYGLAVAAYAKHRGLDCRIVGEPMGFWRHHMPRGMRLRSGIDWHLDPLGRYTFEAFLRFRGLDAASVLPIPVGLYLDYALWFLERSEVLVHSSLVECLDHAGGLYEARLSDGQTIQARNVVVATGSGYFRVLPPEVVRNLPPSRYAHTCDMVDFQPLRGKRCLIVGGRQSAYEWAALIHEECQAEIHVVYPHETPRFEASDWSWVDRQVEEMLGSPGWFQRLDPTEREAVEARFEEEGRQKLEPWLWARLGTDDIISWPKRRVADCGESDNGQVDVWLGNELRLHVDFVVLATGYRVDIRRLPFLSSDTVLPGLETHQGFPSLDEYFQASLPGLFFCGLPASRDFGPFFGFVRGCAVSARLIVDHLAG